MKQLFSKLAIAFFIVAGFVLLLTDKARWPAYYDLPYMGWAALACAVAIFVFPKHYQSALALILLFNASGDLGLYELYRHGFEYDKVIHFVSPLIATLGLAKYLGVKRAILIVIAGAVGWELFEFLSDALIKTHLFGVYRHQIFRDTLTDLAMNLLGILTAICYTFLQHDRSRNIHQSRASV